MDRQTESFNPPITRSNINPQMLSSSNTPRSLRNTARLSNSKN